MTKLLRNLLIGAGMLAAATHAASAADWPSKRLTIVFPFAAGSGTDAYLKYLAQKISAKYGNAVIVENRPGAGGSVGSAFAARSAPDGYTMVAAPGGPLVYDDLMFKNPGYVPMQDLVPVTMVMDFPTIMEASNKSGITSVADLIAKAKANPGKITFATSGVGSTPHLAIELLADMAGLKMVHVPYPGSSQAVLDVEAGNVDIGVDQVQPALQAIKGGLVKGIGISSTKRWPTAADIPTIAETLPGYESNLWIALAASKDTPLALRNQIAKIIDDILREPEATQKLLELGGTVPPGGVDAMDAKMKAERTKWVELIKHLKIEPQ